MDAVQLTRALVDIESTTGAEAAAAEYLYAYLAVLAARTGGIAERMVVTQERFNVLATWGTPVVTLSTHMDTVPPFFASREDDDFVWGRGSCDAKGIIAAMVAAAERLLAAGTRNFGLLFVVGEEKDSLGSLAAAKDSRGSRFLINGEPTENQLALGSKGALRFELIARGKLAHSAYPELGESAIEKLLDVLEDVRRMPLPSDELLGKSTLNMGTIVGGRAPNVIADHAQAELMFRLVGNSAVVRDALAAVVRGRVEVREALCTEPIRMEAVDGLPSTVVAFTTDIPNFAGAWGKPLLIGPGSIHVAHTAEERIAKKDLQEAVGIYERMVTQLLAGAA
ncbi:MAG TPA: M20/M25/M40 family metallo-hydrolase [Candidatus Acidoferrum sp.]|nr:M20/M25/M40 family metallo-hydrolase [Candidatus Acidoferrum sp.]